MFTKGQLLQIIPDVPEEFSIKELEAILSRLHPATVVKPVGRASQETADWEYYNSPKAAHLYARLPLSPEVESLRGIAAHLPPENLRKSAKEWEAERIQMKYGV